MKLYENINEEAVAACAETLNKGGIAVFPTETVYGIGVDAFNETAIAQLYKRKQRPYDKPLLMHISGIEMAEEIAYLDDNARMLINKYTPGPLTLVVKSKPCVPKIALANGDTVGLRFPSNKAFLEISKSFGAPIAATSANLSGNKSAITASELEPVMNIANIVLTDGECELGLESTILSLVGEKPKILREGSFPRELIEECIGKCD